MRELWIAAIVAALSSVACGGAQKCNCPAAAAAAAPAEPVACVEAPPPPPRVGHKPAGGFTTGSPQCDEYLWTFDEVVARCGDKMGSALDAMIQSRDAQAEAFKSWDALDPESRKATIEAATSGCAAATNAMLEAAVALECPIE